MRYFLIAAVTSLFTFHVQASVEQQLAHCSTITDQSARLACYDHLAQAVTQAKKTIPANEPAMNPKDLLVPSEPIAENSVSAPEKPAAPIPTPATPKNNEKAVAQFGAPVERADAALEQIQDVVTKAQKGLRGTFTITLSNGQVWQQIDSESFRIKNGQKVVIEKAALGSFLLKVEGSNRTIRVKRLQ
ncbi:hypothetical protein KDN34_15740 [Shewanella yunxiaonensis]|uniref:Uncharacterized protein n=1 Tax=Shewanella yunxiaonensis TaxID=2829809 RepID=A0ABX7YSY7_9GAMM|nr:hypothetical protein [Shewanella yunxiaonensis]QUN05618.1 hypothetical protein KDN34_15740 [Shewanella yunxiaonensis]